MNQAFYFAIDVECIASGVEHNSRAVAQISLVVSTSQSLQPRCLILQATKPVNARRV
jgi:hypothetical protein